MLNPLQFEIASRSSGRSIENNLRIELEINKSIPVYDRDLSLIHHSSTENRRIEEKHAKAIVLFFAIKRSSRRYEGLL